MSGIGPVASHRTRRSHNRGNPVPRNELEIFCNLCVGRVYYRDETRTLYFVDSPVLSVSDIILQVFRGLGQTPSIRQLYMDEHNLFSAARCIQLTGSQFAALFIAFNLSDIQIVRPGCR